jgi:glycogen synthase
MKVLLLGPYPPPHGGVEINLAAIRNFLLKRQIPCAVINLTRHRKPEGEGVYYPKAAPQVLWRILCLRPDIMHLHIGGNVSWRLLGLGFACSLVPRSKVLLTLHSGGYPSSPAARGLRRRGLRGFLFRQFDGLIAVNQEIMELFRRLGVSAERIRLIAPHALPARAPEIAFPTCMQNFFQSHGPVLLTVSGLEPEYDLPLQIEVLGLIRAKFPNAGLAIVGGGSREDELRRQIAAKPYGSHVILCGDVPHEVALRAMSESDAFLRTTLYDGDSIAVREALHLRVPVIATDNSMRPSGVRLIPPSDLSALRRAIEECLPEERPLRGQSEGDESNLEAVLQFYEETLNR